MLNPKTPLPFVGVVPAVRVGLTTFDAQDLEMPLGVSSKSYAYCYNGRTITKAKYNKDKLNETYCKSFIHSQREATNSSIL